MNMEEQSPDKNENTNNGKGEPTFNIQKIDRVVFIVAVLLYLLFNVVYWLTFLNFKF